MSHETVSLLDVRRFGAFGDGINDDGRAIQAAADALKEFSGFKGGSVGLPPGRYLITTPVTLPDGITIQGVGTDSVLVLPSSAVPYSAFISLTTHSAEFRNVEFEGPVASVGTIYAVEKQGTGTLQFTHVTATNPTNANVLMPTGAVFTLAECNEVGEDVDVTAGGPFTLVHLGGGLWGGNNHPRQIKGDVDPSAGAGVDAPMGSFYQSTTGVFYVKDGLLNTDWTATVGIPSPLSNTAPVDVDTAVAAAGIAGEASRQDHKHDISTGTPGTIEPDDTAAEGTATSLARSDHQHAIAADVPVDVGAANAEGVSTAFARADHVHKGSAGAAIYSAQGAPVTIAGIASADLLGANAYTPGAGAARTFRVRFAVSYLGTVGATTGLGGGFEILAVYNVDAAGTIAATAGAATAPLDARNPAFNAGDTVTVTIVGGTALSIFGSNAAAGETNIWQAGIFVESLASA